MSFRLLRIAVIAQAATLALLLGNLLTVAEGMVSALVGAVHGVAYLMVVLIALRLPGSDATMRLHALIPGVGGAAVLHRAHRIHRVRPARRSDRPDRPDPGFGPTAAAR
ncbi:DUF3817 domain-containing protein [Streptomyces sp. NPDC000594]|uniref:DUF3817 domain-containing protein n=1 Tax=Streptomyces sp. NPDC000594 TaxID=3154261 RepID=UPI00331757B1